MRVAPDGSAATLRQVDPADSITARCVNKPSCDWLQVCPSADHANQLYWQLPPRGSSDEHNATRGQPRAGAAVGYIARKSAGGSPRMALEHSRPKVALSNPSVSRLSVEQQILAFLRDELPPW